MIGCLLLAAAPAAAQTDGVAGVGAYDHIIRPGDVLRIAVWPDSTLGGQFAVEETGSVHLPLVGELAVDGVPISRVRSILRERYAETLRAPVVSVTPLFNVSLLGAVRQPGLYQVEPAQSLFAVISEAGGFTDRAKPGELRIVRSGRVISVDAERAFEEGAPTLDLALQSGDRIVVPEQRWNITLRDVVMALQTVALVWTLIDRAGR